MELAARKHQRDARHATERTMAGDVEETCDGKK